MQSSEIDHKDHDYCNDDANKSSSLSYDVLPNVVTTGDAWQTVLPIRNKRLGSNIQCNANKKQYSGQDSSIDLPLNNKFDTLGDEDSMEATATHSNEKELKPPPVFIPDITNIRAMVTSVETVISKSDYVYKCLSTNKIKINAVTIEAYRKLVRYLTERQISFYTFQIKSERAYRVVLKNMHFSNDVGDIKSAIEDHGHKVRNVSNLKSKTKGPLSIFFVDLEPADNNKDIYKINFLLNAKIVFEPPYKSKDVVQCKRCQRYGHTKSYCWNPSRCVKCGLNHETIACKKSVNVPPKCVLCGGEHPANYKGCTVYKDIKNKSSAPQRRHDKLTSGTENAIRGIVPNSSPSLNEQNFPRTNFPHPQTINTNRHSSKVSYADVAARKNVVDENAISISETINMFFNKFERLMEQQAQQIGSLVNLLTTVISKMK